MALFYNYAVEAYSKLLHTRYIIVKPLLQLLANFLYKNIGLILFGLNLIIMFIILSTTQP